ncbi:MAG: DoxX family protein [Planctomycetota bacterium]|nr:DoxX family protein [Planctomycetota bacterium]
MDPLRKLDSTGFPLLVARLVVGFTFLYYGAQKIADPIGFLKSIEAYNLLPTEPSWIINLIAVVLPWVEVLCAAALLSGIKFRSAALLTCAMLLVFTPAIYLLGTSLIGTKPEFQGLCDVIADCGCGSGAVPVCPKLATNCGLLLLSVWALLSRSTRFRGGLIPGVG